MLNQTEFIGTPFSESLRIVLVAIGIAVLLSGILGNGLLLDVMWRSRREVMGISNIFIANLALADLVVVCCGMPFFVVDLLWNRHPVAGTLHCKLNGFVLSVGYSVSIFSLMLISFNRYVKVCHSNVFHRLFSPRRNKIFCLLLWGTGIFLNLPFFLPAVPSYGYDPRVHMCNARADRTYADYGSVAMIILLLVPVFLIGYFNAAIFKRWRDTRRKLQRYKGKERREFKVKGKRSASVSVKGLTSERNNTTMEESTEVNTDVGHVIELVAGKLNDTDMTSSKDSVTAVDIESKDDQPGLTLSDLNELGRQTSDEVNEQLRKPSNKIISSPFRSQPLVLNTEPDTRVKTLVTSRSSASVRRPDQDLCPGGVNLCCATDFDNTGSSAEAATRTPGKKGDTTDADDARASDKESKMHRFAEQIRSDECSGSSRRPTNKPSVQNVQTQQRSAATACNDRKQTSTVSEVALVRSLLVIFICFFVLYTPFAVTLILTYFLHVSVPTELPVICALFLFVNCAINWIIYGVMNTVFRHAYVTTLKNLWNYCCGTCTICPVSSRRNIDA